MVRMKPGGSSQQAPPERPKPITPHKSLPHQTLQKRFLRLCIIRLADGDRLFQIVGAVPWITAIVVSGGSVKGTGSSDVQSGVRRDEEFAIRHLRNESEIDDITRVTLKKQGIQAVFEIGKLPVGLVDLAVGGMYQN